MQYYIPFFRIWYAVGNKMKSRIFKKYKIREEKLRKEQKEGFGYWIK